MNDYFEPVVYVLDLDNPQEYVSVERMHFRSAAPDTPKIAVSGPRRVFCLMSMTHRRTWCTTPSRDVSLDRAVEVSTEALLNEMQNGGAAAPAGIVITTNLEYLRAQGVCQRLKTRIPGVKVLAEGSRMSDKDKDSDRNVGMVLRLLETGAFAQ